MKNNASRHKGIYNSRNYIWLIVGIPGVPIFALSTIVEITFGL